MSVGSLTSCRNRPVDDPVPSYLTLSARVVSLEYGKQEAWENEAEVGVFVTETGSNVLVSGNENIRYKAEKTIGLIPLAPAADPVLLPDDGVVVDIAAYYPYSPGIVADSDGRYLYEVDLTDQTSPQPRMLLLSRVAQRNSVMNTAMLTMRPAYSKLKLTVSADTETKSSGSELSLAISGMPFEASVDLISGEYVSYGADRNVSLLKTSRYTYEVILLAHTIAEDALLTVTEVTSDGTQTHSVRLDDILASIEQNKLYDLNISVSPDGIDATLVGLSDLYVSDWKDDFEDVNGEVR